MKIEPIAFFRSPFTSKFGIPRQSGIVGELRGRIEFVADYRQAEALRGLQDYDYLWLIWGFSENVDAVKHPTVRPPLLGGNERVGVWATRSPFRPNNLGLSSVRMRRSSRMTSSSFFSVSASMTRLAMRSASSRNISGEACRQRKVQLLSILWNSCGRPGLNSTSSPASTR